MSSSYLPVCSTTLSADSLGTDRAEPGSLTPWRAGPPPARSLLPSTRGDVHQLRGPPAHSLGGRDEAFRPARVLGVKFLLRGCPLVVTREKAGRESQRHHLRQWVLTAPSPLPPGPRQHRGFSCDSQAHGVHWGGLSSLALQVSHVQLKPQGGVVGDDEGPAVMSPPGTDPCCWPSCVACLTGKDPAWRPSSPCHSPRSPSAGWWMLSPGAEWPAKTQTYVTLGVAIPAAEPARLRGPSWLLTFIRSVQELRIL